MAATLFVVGPLFAQANTRNLKGVVMDAQHEPLRGAVVTLQNESTGAAVTFLSERDGSYSFKRLFVSSDYHVWATYRGKESKKEEMSHFDSKPDRVIELVVRLD